MSQAPVIRRRGSRDLSPNHKRLYQLVRLSGQLSRADLMRQSGLTFPSVSRLAADLLELGLLKEGATRRGGMGKPPTDLSVDAEHGYSLGISVEGDTARGRFIDALGGTLKEFSFPASPFSEGIATALSDSGLERTRLVGLCLSTPGELIGDDERKQLAAELGVDVFAESTVAARVKAERYFGSGSQLGRFLYFDAHQLELGALVNGTVLAQPGTLGALAGVRREGTSASRDVLPEMLEGAAALVQAEALVVGGLSAEDLERLSKSMGDLPVVPASIQADDPALAAAAVPLDETFGV